MEPEDQEVGPKGPGVCIPWEQMLRELPEKVDDEEVLKRVWQDVDSLAYTCIWHCLVSF
jgi:hypothetical protein